MLIYDTFCHGQPIQSHQRSPKLTQSRLPQSWHTSAELHCWRINGNTEGKDIELPSTHLQPFIYQTSSFSNVYALLKVHVFFLGDESWEWNTMKMGKDLKVYLMNTLTNQRSSNLASLNINSWYKTILSIFNGGYICHKLFTSKPEPCQIIQGPLKIPKDF